MLHAIMHATSSDRDARMCAGLGCESSKPCTQLLHGRRTLGERRGQRRGSWWSAMALLLHRLHSQRWPCLCEVRGQRWLDDLRLGRVQCQAVVRQPVAQGASTSFNGLDSSSSLLAKTYRYVSSASWWCREPNEFVTFARLTKRNPLLEALVSSHPSGTCLRECFRVTRQTN